MRHWSVDRRYRWLFAIGLSLAVTTAIIVVTHSGRAATHLEVSNRSRPKDLVRSMVIKGRPASSSELAAMAGVVDAQHIGDFSSARDYLAYARVTNNGWGAASIVVRGSAERRASRPGGVHNRTIIFRREKGRWAVVAYGSSYLHGAAFQGLGVPRVVLEALGVLQNSKKEPGNA